MKAQAGQINRYKQAIGKRNNKSDLSPEQKMAAKSTALGRNIRVRSREGVQGPKRIRGGGSLEGLGDERPAWIHMNGNGYDRKMNARYARKDFGGRVPMPRSINMSAPTGQSISNYCYNGAKNSSLETLNRRMSL